MAIALPGLPKGSSSCRNRRGGEQIPAGVTPNSTGSVKLSAPGPGARAMIDFPHGLRARGLQGEEAATKEALEARDGWGSRA